MLSKIKRVYGSIVDWSHSLPLVESEFELSLEQHIRTRQLDHPNPLVRYGRKGYSQSDEDGITFEVLRRLGINQGCFVEFGVGDGTENNTLALIGLGWHGLWVGGDNLAFDTERLKYLHYVRDWVTRENIVDLYEHGMKRLSISSPNVVSIDLDGNDYWFCEELLKSGCVPSLFIVEYNARFPPPMRFTIPYDPHHTWKSDDYHGASLQTLNDLFESHGYRLICCNAATGVNAYFVKIEHMDLFHEVPKDIRDIYSSPSFLLHRKFGHRTSVRTIEAMIESVPPFS